MSSRAVVFDLFGTLVDNNSFIGSPSAEWRAMLRHMAAAVGADPDAFDAGWAQDAPRRTAGAFETVEACVSSVCSALNLEPDESCVSQAAALRVDFMRRGLSPRPDAVPTLQALRAAGLRIGLISNCIPDVPLLWAATPFATLIDVPIFSAAVRLAKPDPRIFQLACDQLGVAPHEAVFVADGEGGELAGAASIGMQAVLIRCSYADPLRHRRPHVESWDGPTIDWLSEVPALVCN
jgi:putative hydrolase of the HAD superfamily